MTRKALHRYGIVLLSAVIMISGTACCCIRDVYANPGTEKPYRHCCPDSAGPKVPDAGHECTCQSHLKALAVLPSDVRPESFMAFGEGLPYPSAANHGDFVSIIGYAQKSPLSSDPPIYILNCVYRC